ncbi:MULTISPECIES: recombinase family protein [Nocardia]|uniref:recombinase family protein n=1 Tax=Nocardia TaxID=1817 RepID=UPI0009E74648
MAPRIWVDKASGKPARCPEWDKCFDHLRRGVELVITRLSRPCRSVRHTSEPAARLDERGIDLSLLKQGIDHHRLRRTVPVARHTPLHRRAHRRDLRRPSQDGLPQPRPRQRGTHTTTIVHYFLDTD